MLILLELHCKDADMSATSSRTFSRYHIVNLRRLVVIVRYVVIRVVLVIEGKVDASHSDAIEGCRGRARHFGRVDEPGLRLYV